jgi:2-polyprenyl-6-hydroxyphenyl methylase / 3-demethylubiquinone-9 3-methyltransferase
MPLKDESKDCNVNQDEINHFNQQAADWWDLHGPMSTLHIINPLRLKYTKEFLNLKDKHVLDLGCGGGIFSETLAHEGASVTGLDLGAEAIKVAIQHAKKQKLAIKYREQSIEEHSAPVKGGYDAIFCFEMLEHVPDPKRIIENCTQILKPGGWFIASTINRTAKAFLLAIVGAEYILNIIPKGSHHYDQLICPSELSSWTNACLLKQRDIRGMHYNPFFKQASFTEDLSINYFVAYQKAKI